MGMMNKVVLDKIEDNMPRKVDYARIYRMVLLKAIESPDLFHEMFSV